MKNKLRKSSLLIFIALFLVSAMSLPTIAAPSPQDFIGQYSGTFRFAASSYTSEALKEDVDSVKATFTGGSTQDVWISDVNGTISFVLASGLSGPLEVSGSELKTTFTPLEIFGTTTSGNMRGRFTMKNGAPSLVLYVEIIVAYSGQGKKKGQSYTYGVNFTNDPALLPSLPDVPLDDAAMDTLMPAQTGETTEPSLEITSIRLAPRTMVLQVGGSKPLNVTILPTDASPTEVIIDSYDSTYITVDEQAVVTGLKLTPMRDASADRGEPIKVVVKTRDGKFTDTCMVFVVPEDVYGVVMQATPTSVLFIDGHKTYMPPLYTYLHNDWRFLQYDGGEGLGAYYTSVKYGMMQAPLDPVETAREEAEQDAWEYRDPETDPKDMLDYLKGVANNAAKKAWGKIRSTIFSQKALEQFDEPREMTQGIGVRG